MSLSFLLVWSGVGCQTPPRRLVPEKLIPFTARHVDHFSDDLEEIQFYISRRVVLHRIIELKTKDASQPAGTLRAEKDTESQSIIFPACTPGVMTGIEDGVLMIQFEPIRESEDQTIPFRPGHRDGTESDPQTIVFVFDVERLTYGGNEYKVHYEKEDEAAAVEDNTLSAGKAGPAQGGFFAGKRYPILLINPIHSISRFKKENQAPTVIGKETRHD